MRWAVAGALTFDTTPEWLARGQAFIAEQDGEIDFGEVTACDSSAMALLVAWARVARQKQRTLRFVHVPLPLRMMIKVHGLKRILPIHG